MAADPDDEGHAYARGHADDPRLSRVAVLDPVINHADPKGGHVLYPPARRSHGVDHGVCFHVENKLRTVLWGWTGKQIPAESLEVLARLAEQLDGTLGDALEEHLTLTEVQHARLRVRRLLRSSRFPKPPQDWPAVPWPPV